LPLAFAALFAAPAYEGWPARLAFVTCAYLAATTAYSVFAVPYVALPGDLARDPHGRTRIVAYRMVFVAIGVLFAGALAPALIGHWGGDRAAYATGGLLMAVTSGACMLAAFAGSASARIEPGVLGGEPLWAQLRACAAARPFRSLAAVYGVQMVSNGANAAMLVYAARYLLDAGEALVGLFFAVFTIASVAATPAFAVAGRRWGKRAGFVRASWIYAGGLALLFLAVRGGDAVLLACAALAGVGSAGTQLFAFALLPDVIDADREATGAAREGVFTGVWIAGEKLGLAAGAALAGLALDLAGFVEGGADGQPPAALAAVLLMFSLVPAALMAGSLLLFDPSPPGALMPADARVIVLGAGVVGRAAARYAAASPFVADIVVADRDLGAAERALAEAGGRGTATPVDVTDPQALAHLLGGADAVLNCVGPFYRFGPAVLAAAIAARCPYLDVCDDWEPTLEMLAQDPTARAAGVVAVVGQGASPGNANLLAAAAMSVVPDAHTLLTGWSPRR
jgi:Na+/melibiose symporter-like transporter